MEENPSEPPHCSPMVRWEASTVLRVARFASGSISFTAATPASMAFFVPPTSCITSVRSIGPAVRPWSASIAGIWLRSQPSPTTSTPATLAWRI